METKSLTVKLTNGQERTYRVETVECGYLLHGARGAVYAVIRRHDGTLFAMTRSARFPLEGVVLTDAHGTLAQK